VSSVAFDKGTGVAYATIRQTFDIWFIPGYRADVQFVVRLQLVRDSHWRKWYIERQEDCYPVVEASKFAWLGLWRVVMFFQFFATVVCVLCSWLGAPLTWFMDKYSGGLGADPGFSNGLDRHDEKLTNGMDSSENTDNGILKILGS